MSKKNIAVIHNKNIEFPYFNVINLNPENLSLTDDCDLCCVYTGFIDSYENIEKTKKFIIDKKIGGAFITTRLNLYNNGSVINDFDKNYIKKLKELCLFSDLISFNFNESLLFSNINNEKEWEEKDVENLIFILNSYGMANKLIISEFPIKGKGMCTIVSEYGECKVLSKEITDEKRDLFLSLVLEKIISGEKFLSSIEYAFSKI